jgi:hypothetical protein
MTDRPTHGTVSREVDGKFYSATWTVSGLDRADMVYVAGQGDLAGLTETAQLGGSPPEGLVGQMLREMVKKKRGL